MVSCSVMDCTTSARNNPDNYSFHRFPLNSVKRNAWLRIIDRSDWMPKKSSCLCSKHFEDKYIQFQKKKRVLSPSAIPTKFVPIKLSPERTVTSYVYRDIVVEPTCIPTSLSQSQSVPPLLPSLDLPQPPTPQKAPSHLELTPKERKLLSKCSKLREKILKQQRTIKNLKAQKQRIENKVITLESLLDEVLKRAGLKDHLYDIYAVCSNETLPDCGE